MAFWCNFDRVHYDYYGSSGVKEDLKSITYEEFMDFKEKYFSKPSSFDYVHDAGHPDLDESWLEGYEEKYGEVEFSEEPEKFSVVKKFSDSHPDAVPPEHCSDFDTQRILMMNTELGCGDRMLGYAYGSLLANILYNGVSSVLYRELRDKTGNVYSIDSWYEPIGGKRFRMQVLLTVQSEVADDMMRRLQDTIENLDELITKKDFRVHLAQMKNGFRLTSQGTYDNENEFDPFEGSVRYNAMLDRMDYDGFLDFLDGFLDSGIGYYRDDELD